MESVEGPSKNPADIARMFDAIAGRYDALNRLLSIGLDRHWRRCAIDALELSGRETLADVCTGTADLALAARRAPRGAAKVIGVDFAAAMLAMGRDKIAAARFAASMLLVRGDATALPMRAGTADAATIAFGIRNVEDPVQACRELSRILKPGGRVAILEFGIPWVPVFRSVYLWYFRVLLPRIGGWVSRHGSAYSYLPASVGAFPPPAEFVEMLTTAGLMRVRVIPLTGGIVYLYLATKSPGAPTGAG